MPSGVFSRNRECAADKHVGVVWGFQVRIVGAFFAGMTEQDFEVVGYKRDLHDRVVVLLVADQRVTARLVHARSRDEAWPLRARAVRVEGSSGSSSLGIRGPTLCGQRAASRRRLNPAVRLGETSLSDLQGRRVASSIGAGYVTFRTGDLGAKAVWQGRLQAAHGGGPGGTGLHRPPGTGAP